MTKLRASRTVAAAMLIAVSILFAACDQRSGSSANPPGSSTPAGNEKAGATPAGDAASGGIASPTTAEAITPEGTIVSLDATATIALGGEGDPPAEGLDLLSVDPCKLLTQDEVQSAMGDVPYEPKPLTQEAYHTACSYVEPTLEVNSPRLLLSLDPTEMWDWQLPDVQPVSGIGDGAYTRDFDGWRSMWVLVKKKAVVEMDIYPPDTEKAKQLISKAMERLP